MATKKTIITKDQIVSIYMNYVLEHSEKPKSVCHFAKINDFTETEFYAFFGTIESVEKEIFKLFADKTVELFSKNKDYETYDMKSKMLSFYFTFFEIILPGLFCAKVFQLFPLFADELFTKKF